MKVQLETIPNKVNRSFSMMFNPRLNDLFLALSPGVRTRLY